MATLPSWQPSLLPGIIADDRDKNGKGGSSSKLSASKSAKSSFSSKMKQMNMGGMMMMMMNAKGGMKMKHLQFDSMDANDSIPSLSPTIIYHEPSAPGKGTSKASSSSSSEAGKGSNDVSKARGQHGVNKQVIRAFQRAGTRNSTDSTAIAEKETSLSDESSLASNSSDTDQR
jgi:hypothetical protein